MIETIRLKVLLMLGFILQPNLQIDCVEDDRFLLYIIVFNFIVFRVAQAYIKRPFGSGISRPNSFAVSIHS